MNRAQMVQAIAACDVLAAELRKALRADAEAEYVEQGTAPTWRMPGYTVSTSISHDAVVVADEKAWRAWVGRDHPGEIETVSYVRRSFQDAFLASLGENGRMDPPHTADGEIVPGLVFVPGGEFRSVSVLPMPATRSSLRAIAADIAMGRRPLGLPETVEVYP